MLAIPDLWLILGAFLAVAILAPCVWFTTKKFTSPKAFPWVICSIMFVSAMIFREFFPRGKPARIPDWLGDYLYTWWN